MTYFGAAVALLSGISVLTLMFAARRVRQVMSGRVGHPGESTDVDSPAASSVNPRPPRVFVAAPMSYLTGAELARLSGLVADVTQAVQAQGMEVVTPLEAVDREDVLSPAYSDVSRRLLAESDAVIAVATDASSAIDAHVATAAASGAAVLALVTAGATVGALAALPSVTVAALAGVAQTSAVVAAWLSERRSDLETHRARRVKIWGELESILPDLRRRIIESAEDDPVGLGMSKQRLLALVSHPAVYASASLGEVMELHAALGVPVPTPRVLDRRNSPEAELFGGQALQAGSITPREWSALMVAAAQSRWTDVEVAAAVERHLERSSVQSLTGARRQDLTSVAGWRALVEEFGVTSKEPR